jgi:hypothetical protein
LQVPGFDEWFNVKYEEENDKYTCKQAEEFNTGDVEVIK